MSTNDMLNRTVWCLQIIIITCPAMAALLFDPWTTWSRGLRKDTKGCSIRSMPLVPTPCFSCGICRQLGKDARSLHASCLRCGVRQLSGTMLSCRAFPGAARRTAHSRRDNSLNNFRCIKAVGKQRLHICASAAHADKGAPDSHLGVVIVDHGSRKKDSNDMLIEFGALYQKCTGRTNVEVAHMELAHPTIEEAIGEHKMCGPGAHKTSMEAVQKAFCNLNSVLLPSLLGISSAEFACVA